MSLRFKILALILGLLATFSGGTYAGWRWRGEKVVTVTDIKTEVVEKEKVVTKTVIVKEKKPDGTTTTTTTTEKVEDTVVKTEKEQPQSVAGLLPSRRDWSLGVMATPRMDADWYRPTGVEIGYRMVGAVWVTGEYDWRHREARLGVRVEL